ncbi:hypothetical protein NSQ20_21320 [Paenibacillus sp. FSL K6-1122]|uniref:hypothetical protein n=1 Tax=Paenibacillus sp. FSL K6-1122 TaxID=2954512 RepID=UPI0030EE35AC
MIVDWIGRLIRWNEVIVNDYISFIPHWIKLYYLVFCETTIFLLLIELIMRFLLRLIAVLNNYGLHHASLNSVHKPNLLIKIYILYYSISKFIFNVRKIIPDLWGEYKFPKLNQNLYDSLADRGFLGAVSNLFISAWIPSKRMISSIIIVLYFYYKGEIEWLFNINLYEITFNEVDSVTGLLTKLIALATTGLLVVVTWRNLSLKGRQMRAINKANQNYTENLVEIHRRLLPIASMIVYKATLNLEIVLKNKDRILNQQLKNITPYIKYVNGNFICGEELDSFRQNALDYINVDEIKEIDELFLILEKAKKENLMVNFNLFFVLDYDMRTFDFEFAHKDYMKKVSFVRSSFIKQIQMTEYQKNLFKNMNLSNEDESYKTYYKEKLAEFYKENEKKFNTDIINSVEMIVQLRKYAIACNKVLNMKSSKVDGWLRSIADRD